MPDVCVMSFDLNEMKERRERNTVCAINAKMPIQICEISTIRPVDTFPLSSCMHEDNRENESRKVEKILERL
jgi:hypothetical protein